MAKNSNVTYTNISITQPGPAKTALDNLAKAEAVFEKAALEALTKAGAIPAGLHGKIVRNRFGAGWQLALSTTPWVTGQSANAVSI